MAARSPLASAGRLIRLGVTAELRNPALRLLSAVTAVACAVYAYNQGDLAGSTSVALASWVGRGFGAAACLWFAYSAVRDQNEKSGAVLRSKPVDGAVWLALSWATGALVWLVLLGLPFLAAALAQLPAAGVNSPAAHAVGYARAALALLGMATLSFAFSRLFRSPLGGVLVPFAWVCAMAGARFIPTYLQPDYSQNRPLFLAAALLVLAITALLVERFRRGELRRLAPAAAVCVALLILTGATAARAYRLAPQADQRDTTVWTQMAIQHIEQGKRLPGFWLPDGRGGIVRTSDHAGKILLVYLFQAEDLESTRMLPVLDRIGKEFREQGVQPIGVCISPDHGDGWVFSRLGGYSFPIGSDIMAVRRTPVPDSPLVSAYDLSLLPALVITDRRRRVREVLPEQIADPEALRRRVQARLAEEPE